MGRCSGWRVAISVGSALLGTTANAQRWRPIDGPGSVPDCALFTDYSGVGLQLLSAEYESFLVWRHDSSGWHFVPTDSPPRYRYGFAGAHDFVSGRTYVFGGNVGASPVAETWSFDGARWQHLTSALGPAPRSTAAMVFDVMRARIVLFGGTDTMNAQLADTWEFDGTNWSQLVTPVAPSARAQASMTYDLAGARVVMVGGVGPAITNGETWVLDSSGWSQLPTPFARL